MDKKVKSLAWFLPAALIFAAGFTVSTLCDLDINISLYNPRNVFAIIMEAAGWFPAFIPVVVYGMALAAFGIKNQKSPAFVLGGGIVAAVSPVAMGYKAFEHFKMRGIAESIGSPAGIALVCAMLISFVILALFSFKIPEEIRKRVMFWGLAGSILMAAVQVAYTAVKILWQRTRFDEMMVIENFDFFTPWYLPFGHGGSSFPSGHTANMGCILMLVVLCDLFPAWDKNRKWVYAACWLCIVLMAGARVVIGRHFLSDTLAGALLTSVIFYAMRRTKAYKRGLERLS